MTDHGSRKSSRDSSLDPLYHSSQASSGGPSAAPQLSSTAPVDGPNLPRRSSLVLTPLLAHRSDSGIASTAPSQPSAVPTAAKRARGAARPTSRTSLPASILSDAWRVFVNEPALPSPVTPSRAPDELTSTAVQQRAQRYAPSSSSSQKGGSGKARATALEVEVLLSASLAELLEECVMPTAMTASAPITKSEKTSERVDSPSRTDDGAPNEVSVRPRAGGTPVPATSSSAIMYTWEDEDYTALHTPLSKADTTAPYRASTSPHEDQIVARQNSLQGALNAPASIPPAAATRTTAPATTSVRSVSRNAVLAIPRAGPSNGTAAAMTTTAATDAATAAGVDDLPLCDYYEIDLFEGFFDGLNGVEGVGEWQEEYLEEYDDTVSSSSTPGTASTAAGEGETNGAAEGRAQRTESAQSNTPAPMMEYLVYSWPPLSAEEESLHSELPDFPAAATPSVPPPPPPPPAAPPVAVMELPGLPEERPSTQPHLMRAHTTRATSATGVLVPVLRRSRNASPAPGTSITSLRPWGFLFLTEESLDDEEEDEEGEVVGVDVERSPRAASRSFPFVLTSRSGSNVQLPKLSVPTPRASQQFARTQAQPSQSPRAHPSGPLEASARSSASSLIPLTTSKTGGPAVASTAPTFSSSAAAAAQYATLDAVLISSSAPPAMSITVSIPPPPPPPPAGGGVPQPPVTRSGAPPPPPPPRTLPTISTPGAVWAYFTSTVDPLSAGVMNDGDSESESDGGQWMDYDTDVKLSPSAQPDRMTGAEVRQLGALPALATSGGSREPEKGGKRPPSATGGANGTSGHPSSEVQDTPLGTLPLRLHGPRPPSRADSHSWRRQSVRNSKLSPLTSSATNSATRRTRLPNEVPVMASIDRVHSTALSPNGKSVESLTAHPELSGVFSSTAVRVDTRPVKPPREEQFLFHRRPVPCTAHLEALSNKTSVDTVNSTASSRHRRAVREAVMSEPPVDVASKGKEVVTAADAPPADMEAPAASSVMIPVPPLPPPSPSASSSADRNEQRTSGTTRKAVPPISVPLALPDTVSPSKISAQEASMSGGSAAPLEPRHSLSPTLPSAPASFDTHSERRPPSQPNVPSPKVPHSAHRPPQSVAQQPAATPFPGCPVVPASRLPKKTVSTVVGGTEARVVYPARTASRLLSESPAVMKRPQSLRQVVFKPRLPPPGAAAGGGVSAKTATPGGATMSGSQKLSFVAMPRVVKGTGPRTRITLRPLRSYEQPSKLVLSRPPTTSSGHSHSATPTPTPTPTPRPATGGESEQASRGPDGAARDGGRASPPPRRRTDTANTTTTTTTTSNSTPDDPACPVPQLENTVPPQEPVANTTAAPAPNGRGAAPRARDRSGDAGRSPRSARVSDTKAPRKGRDRTEPRSHQNGDEDDVVTTHPTESATQSPVTRGTDRLPTQPSPHRGSNPRCSNPNREPSEVSTATDFTEGTSPLVTPAVRTTHSTARRTLTTTMTTASSQMPMSGSERTQQPTVVVSSIGSSTWTAGGMSTDTTTPIVSAQWANIPVPHRSPSKRREMLEQLKEEAGAIERANQERAAAAAAACAAAAGNTSN